MELREITKQEFPIQVIQFGEGNFLRGFADHMIDIANEKGIFQGNIAIVKPRPGGSREVYEAQNCNYTVLLRGKQDGKVLTDTRVVTSVSRFLRACEEYEEYLSLAEEPSLRIVISNTTEAGITLSEEDRFTDTPPVSFPAKLCQFLYHRYQAFDGDLQKGLTILPTELISHNGDTLKALLVTLAADWNLEPGFLTWMEKACVFCNTLVDRIVSGYPKEEADALMAEWGYEDRLAVVGEPFGLWVIESPKPEETQEVFPLHQAGLPVVFTHDLTAYEERKVRVLNGAHTTMVLAAFLAGETIILDCMKNPTIRSYLSMAFAEILPSVPLPSKDVEAFAKEVTERFENPFLQHKLLSIALNSVSKWRARVLPSLKDYLHTQGRLPQILTFSFAALLRFYTPDRVVDGTLFGKRGGEEYPILDTPEVLRFFQEAMALPAKELVQAVAARVDFWGEDLNLFPGFTDSVTGYCQAILQEGMLPLLEKLVKGEEIC